MDEVESATRETNKAISGLKQVNQIRKITMQSLSPVIKKMQQHIEQVLKQCQQLRSKNKLLQQVNSTNVQFKIQINELRQKISQLNKQVLQLDQQKCLQIKKNQKNIYDVQGQIDRLKQDSKTKNQKIQRLIEMNQEQTQLIGISRENIQNSIQNLKSDIHQYYSKEMDEISRLTSKVTEFQFDLTSTSKAIAVYNNQVGDIKKALTLYMSQRDEIKKFMEETVHMKNFAILRQEYEKDKKYQAIQNQIVKNKVKEMLNEALTPQIRSFLPNLIKNIELLKKLQDQTAKINKQIVHISQKQSQIQRSIVDFGVKTKSNIQVLRKEINETSIRADDQFKIAQQKIKLNFKQNIQDFSMLKQKIQTNHSETKTKFQGFLQQNKQKMYMLILQLRPKEQIQQERKMKQKVLAIDREISTVKDELIQRCDNIAEFGDKLQQKLQIFQNRITKAKSDNKVETDNNRKILEEFRQKLKKNQQTIYQQAQIISKLLQISLLNSALSIDEQYLKLSYAKYNEQNVQSYASFHDGVIYQIQSDLNSKKQEEIIYRRKNVNKQILKRTTLNESAKLIDLITEKFADFNWMQKNERPSHFFNQVVLPAYQTMLKDKEKILQSKAQYFSNPNNEDKKDFKKMRSRQFSPKKSQQGINKKSNQGSGKLQQINVKNMSRTIDQESDKFPMIPFTSRQRTQGKQDFMNTTIDFKQSNRKILKKIQRKKPERERYSLNPFN